ncbi:hypothetical protein [Stenotrophomonas sp. PD6]
MHGELRDFRSLPQGRMPRSESAIPSFDAAAVLRTSGKFDGGFDVPYTS